MQAFLWRRLVPVQEALLWVQGNDRRKPLWSAVENRLRLPAGGSALLRFPVPPGQMGNRIELALSDAPEGIAIAEVSQNGGVLQVRFSADRKLKAGLAGNLIVEASALKQPNPANLPPKNNRPAPLGMLPAIPFEIVAR